MDFAVFRVLGGISRDFAEIPEFRGSATAQNIRSPAQGQNVSYQIESPPMSHYCYSSKDPALPLLCQYYLKIVRD